VQHPMIGACVSIQHRRLARAGGLSTGGSAAVITGNAAGMDCSAAAASSNLQQWQRMVARRVSPRVPSSAAAEGVGGKVVQRVGWRACGGAGLGASAAAAGAAARRASGGGMRVYVHDWTAGRYPRPGRSTRWQWSPVGRWLGQEPGRARQGQTHRVMLACMSPSSTSTRAITAVPMSAPKRSRTGWGGEQGRERGRGRGERRDGSLFQPALRRQAQRCCPAPLGGRRQGGVASAPKRRGLGCGRAGFNCAAGCRREGCAPPAPVRPAAWRLRRRCHGRRCRCRRRPEGGRPSARGWAPSVLINPNKGFAR
jgi:hypothetical protein